jgi:hypothetical protein
MPAEKIEKTIKTEKQTPVQTPALNKVASLLKSAGKLLAKRKKLAIGLVAVVLVFSVYRVIAVRGKTQNAVQVKSVTTEINKSFDFSALNNSGKATNTKISMKILSAEKTNQVQVKEQIFAAKNNKMFLIVNLELKNDSTTSQNLSTGDLVRLTISGNEDSKYAPDLHNNLVPISPISTKPDRIGFVIPQEAREFKLYLGEIEGKKDVISITFPS